MALTLKLSSWCSLLRSMVSSGPGCQSLTHGEIIIDKANMNKTSDCSLIYSVIITITFCDHHTVDGWCMMHWCTPVSRLGVMLGRCEMSKWSKWSISCPVTGHCLPPGLRHKISEIFPGCPQLSLSNFYPLFILTFKLSHPELDSCFSLSLWC